MCSKMNTLDPLPKNYTIFVDFAIPFCYTLNMMIERNNKEQNMSNETVQEFLARGGKIKQCKDAKAFGAQKKMTLT